MAQNAKEYFYRPGTKLPHGRQYSSARQLYQDFLQESRIPPNHRIVVGARDPLKTTSPFPPIFNGTVTEDGFVDSHNHSKANGLFYFVCFLI